MSSDNTASREEILSHLEKLTGQTFRSREDVQKYVGQVTTKKQAIQARSTRVWRQVKHTTLLLFLVLSFVQYYFVDILHEVMSLSTLTVFVPVTERDVRSVLQIVSIYSS
jgi:hypothetical protein